jgi:hypothetical protein
MFENLVRNLKGTVTKDIKIADRKLMRYSCIYTLQACGSSHFTLVGTTQNIQCLEKWEGPPKKLKTQQQTKEPFIVKCCFNL